MNSKLILHIPHSSSHIPFYDGFVLPVKDIYHEVSKLTDWFTDELFRSNHGTTLKPEFSRIFCDVERFSNDSLEMMSQVGMGVVYEKTDNGRTLRKVSPELKEKIIGEYYNRHHMMLEAVVAERLRENGMALIIDCHSFPDIPFKRDIHQEIIRPDINIGTDPFHTRKELIKLTESFFQDRGFSVDINRPYSGTMVPLRFYNKDKRVQSIMIEINRRLYLTSNTNRKNGNFQYMQSVFSDFLEWLKAPV